MRFLGHGSVFVLVALAFQPSASAEPEWEPILEEDGVRVFQRDVEGSSLVEFRAIGAIDVPLLRAAAVLRNNGREQEWMQNCVEARVLEWHSPIDATIYNRTASPTFFISDRDLVVQARTTVLEEQGALLINFQSVEHRRAPDVKGVVRMRGVRGHWKLRRIDDHTTEVEYQLRADPGGVIPNWLVNWASRRVPLNTIINMRAQAKKPGYERDEMILDAVIDFSRFAGVHPR